MGEWAGARSGRKTEGRASGLCGGLLDEAVMGESQGKVERV